MSHSIEATYDGTVLRPDAALPLKPNTRVRVTVEELAPAPTADPSASKLTQDAERRRMADELAAEGQRLAREYNLER